MSPSPLIRSDFFSRKFDCDLYFKTEWNGPTRSHKDKWAVRAIQLAKERGVDKVVALSSGNQGLALAVEAAKNNLECAICVEAATDPAYLGLYRKYSAVTILSDDEESQYESFEKLVKQGYFPLGVTHKQRAEGVQMPAIDAYKITAQEIIGSLNTCPDVMVFPTAYADHPEGVLKGFIDMLNKKTIARLPKFILARAKLPDGNGAHSIATNRTTPYITDVIKRTEGSYIYVDNSEMRAAKEAILKRQGWDVELASAASLACLEKAPKSELAGKKVVVMLTALEDKAGI